MDLRVAATACLDLAALGFVVPTTRLARRRDTRVGPATAWGTAGCLALYVAGFAGTGQYVSAALTAWSVACWGFIGLRRRSA